MVAQVTSLLFDVSQIKKASLKPGSENCYRQAFEYSSGKRVADGRSSVMETTSGEVSFGERLTQQRCSRSQSYLQQDISDKLFNY